MQSPAPPLSRGQNLFWIFFLGCFLLPWIAAAFSPLLFGTLIPVLGLLSLILYRPVLGDWPPLPRRFIILLIALLGLPILGLISQLWSVNAAASLRTAFKISSVTLGSFAFFIVARNCPSDIWNKNFLLFPLAVFFIGAICAFELYFGFPIYRGFHGLNSYEVSPELLDRNMALYVLSLPVALYLSLKGRSILFTLSLLALAAVIFIFSNNQIVQFTLLLTILAGFGSLLFLEKVTMRGVFLFAGFIFLMMPWIAPTLFDLLAAKLFLSTGLFSKAGTSLQLESWDFLARRIMEKPLTGFGMDATRHMAFDTDNVFAGGDRINHPHNAPLQIWIEFGLIGIAWILACLGFLYALFSSLRGTVRRLAFVAFCAGFSFLFAAWSLWSSWLIAFFFALAGLISLAGKSARPYLGSKIQ